jgi:hypothetical protein
MQYMPGVSYRFSVCNFAHVDRCSAIANEYKKEIEADRFETNHENFDWE